MCKKLLLALLFFCSGLSLFASSSNIPVSDLEYQALVDFYRATGESSWNNKWNIGENNLHEVIWYGVTIENGHVTGINLSNTNNISGVIPASFGNLKYLKTLSLYGGNYSKDFSTADLGVLSELDALEFLDMRYCKLKGSVPASWAKLKKLKTLYLSYNAFTELPAEFGQIESLVTLEITDNQLTVLIKELENLTALKTLSAERNKISTIAALLSSQVNLRLYNQNLSIKDLVYRGTDLKIDNLPNIVSYNRSRNDFTSRGRFIVRLRGNDVANNIIVAEDGSLTIPASALVTLKKGDELYLYLLNDSDGNVFYGSNIYLTDLKINQPVVSNAEYLALVDFYNAMGGNNWNVKWDISENNLHEGAWNGISIEDGHVTGLDLVYTWGVAGSIPASFGNLKHLKNLSLYGYYSKNLSTTDLNVFSELLSLETLNLISTRLTGAIPSSWSKLKKLRAVYLNNNNITALPETIGEMESLVTFEAVSNQIKTIPVSIGNLANLVSLNLSSNQIEDAIKELENISTLRTLNITSNKISTINASFNNEVNLSLYSQNIDVEGLVYTGSDVIIPSLPEIVNYNRTQNNFSASRQFALYIKGNQVGSNITMAADGSITIPSASFSTLKTGDSFYLYLQRDSGSGNVSYYTKVNFVNVKVDQPQIPNEEYQALVDFYNAMGGG